jgi:acetyltransferase-like isoleucine patch superfamily enzyme
MAADSLTGGAPLQRGLWDLYERLREEKRAQFNRDIPFDELLFDRWERARALGFGAGVSIYHSSLVYGDVKVGAGTWIGPHTLLDGSHGLTIGSTCSISAGVNIYTHDTVQWALSGGAAAAEGAPVVIGNCSHIGSHTVVAKGVTIGDHCVIGAGAFVNRDIAPWTIAVGAPCRPIGRVELRNGRYDLIYDDGRRPA